MNVSSNYWLPDRIKTMNWLWKAFPFLGMSTITENAQKGILDFTEFCYLPLFQLKILNSEASR